MTIHRLRRIFFIFLVGDYLGHLSFTNGFAYPPNFITKIIQEQTSIVPQGLLQVDSVNVSPAGTSFVVSVSKKVSIGQMPQATPFLVKTRFPPEPNGYLHLGHAKAVSFNFAVARMFGGVCHMRLDDTNPSKEDKEYVDSILEDVAWVQQGLYDGKEAPWDGPVRKTSDYFDLIYNCAKALIESGDAYVDSLTAEEMRTFRGTLTEAGQDSPFRTRTVEENLRLFEEMKEGRHPDGAHVVRAKIDMASPNINMRDPTLYRIKHESHQETGDTWCIYPMYDFSHPIADAFEHITHSLCTLEFEDHRPFYDWTIEKLLPTGLIEARPQQIEFSRLNIQSTVLSKRKLIQLVQEKHVQGWDDPRMPTLSGLRRRGVPPQALRLFCERVGISKADSNIEYTVLEDCVREYMDASCPRAFCVLQPLKVTITNWDDDMEHFEVDRHPKLAEMGNKTIPFGKTVYIERSDFFDLDGAEGQLHGGSPPKGFKRLLPGDRVRLRYAYVIECNEILRDHATNDPVELLCTYFPETRAGHTPEGMPRVNGIVHWVEATTAVKCTVNEYDRLFNTDEPGRDSDDFLKDINEESLTVLREVVVEPSVAVDALDLLAKIRQQSRSQAPLVGDKLYPSVLSYQFERSGYYALDKESVDMSNLVFNRVVTLRDTWAMKKSDEQARQRSRGSAKATQQSEDQGESVLEDIQRIALKAATILSAEPHPEADSLLVCQVDCGDVSETDESKPQPRTVVAGLAGKIPMDELVGRKVVAVTNLKPAKMRGIESTAMLLAASNGKEGDDSVVELLNVPETVTNGDLLSFEGKGPPQPDPMLKSKGALKAWDRVKASLRANSKGEAVYVEGGESYRLITKEGPVKSSSLVDAIIQ